MFLVEVLHLLLLASLGAPLTETNNIDVVEPLVIVSPARSADPDDGFGWAAILHQTEIADDRDSMSEALRKTRCSIEN